MAVNMDWRGHIIEYGDPHFARTVMTPGVLHASALGRGECNSGSAAASELSFKEAWLSGEFVPSNKLPILLLQFMQYRCEATSVEGFVQQIACSYLRHGYWWYVTGFIPPHKDRTSVDAKLIEKYGIATSQATRARRKRLGLANLQYIRHEQFFVLMATKGRHKLFEDESASIRDIRKIPIKYRGYSISYRRGGRTRSGQPDTKWHAHVRIDRARYLELKAHLLDLAAHRSADNIALAFYQIPFEP